MYMKTVLTVCGCAGSDEQGTGVMEDAKRDMYMYSRSKCTIMNTDIIIHIQWTMCHMEDMKIM